VTRRARALALLGISAACAGLAASLVNGYASDVQSQVGPLVPVVVARDGIPRGKVLTAQNLSFYLSRRRVPERFVPPDTLRDADEAAGLRPLTRVVAGSYVERAQLQLPSADESRLDSGGRARVVEAPVVGAAALRGLLRPGALVDVLVTSERGSGLPRTYLALQRVELVDLRAQEGGSNTEGQARPADTVAALRVTLRQAILLTAAQNFARELRLVPRPAGDSRRYRRAAVTSADLHP
jgi:pilus assembly protein CpaB